MLSDHNGMKIKINSKKTDLHYINVWRLWDGRVAQVIDVCPVSMRP
jgi:hypothetical protein